MNRDSNNERESSRASTDLFTVSIDIENEEDKLTISQLLDRAYSIYDDINNGSTNLTSDERRSHVLNAIRLLRKISDLANQLQVIPSSNESYDELPSKDLRIMLVNPLLAFFLQAKPCDKLDKRLEIVEEAIICSQQFLNNCRSLSLQNTIDCPISLRDMDALIKKCDKANHLKSEDPIKSNRQFDVTLAAKRRQQKIENYRKTKSVGVDIANLHQQCLHSPLDDTLYRQLYIRQIHFFLLKVSEDLECLLEERCLLISRTMERWPVQLKHDSNNAKQNKPFTLLTAKQDRLRQVLGAGYPSLPTMSIEQFYDSLNDRGILDQCHQLSSSPLSKHPLTDEQIKSNVDEVLEKGNDTEYIRYKREQDEWKDEHWRNEGNRYNRS